MGTMIVKAHLNSAAKWLARTYVGDKYKLMKKKEVLNIIKKNIASSIYEEIKAKKRFKPPINLTVMLNSRNFKKPEDKDLEKDVSGLLLPVEGGFRLIVNKSDDPQKRRFTIAHEIGHSYFYDLSEEKPQIKHIRNNSTKQFEEEWANRIASYILVPKPLIVRDVRNKYKSPTIANLAALRKKDNYYVSYDVMSNRLTNSLNLWDCIIFKSNVITGNKVIVSPKEVWKHKNYKNGWSIPKEFYRGKPLERIYLPGNIPGKLSECFKAQLDGKRYLKLEKKENALVKQPDRKYSIETKALSIRGTYITIIAKQ